MTAEACFTTMLATFAVMLTDLREVRGDAPPCWLEKAIVFYENRAQEAMARVDALPPAAREAAYRECVRHAKTFLMDVVVLLERSVE